MKKGLETDLVMLNIDYLPTFIDIGSGDNDNNYEDQLHLSNSYNFDGHSVLKELENVGVEKGNGRDFLIEYFGENMDQISSTSPCIHQWDSGMSCWTEGNEKLQPGPFSGGILCSCQDSTNNTYACIRRVNGGFNKNSNDVALAENFLYCHFDDNDSFEEYYDIDKDVWQLKNAINDLSSQQHDELKVMLKRFVKCRGNNECR